ncbi:efflux RND transporter periplasmic adaptor subunit [Sphingomonas desiccabilis]|uniref:Efflux RND transporter periplasmic adaptor subunit n=1 Tax=Sphingomonas desiccabilis TaxID=429134 RepID=A0A4V1QNU1_9SPHN|nr:efflux RND transporter periplasmic adaptor subunit [Sphingomonas desiccabilis]MBB3912491.1 membrane fusion protein (multidrug efflux system) [Sphingomonas desiccabilis]RXZ30601.1 efflux RND transporter periplasmic adaptor subunit [Sphingomonas desiccabilis]
MHPAFPRATLSMLAAALLLAGCSHEEAQEKGGGRGGARGPAQVGFVVVQPTSVAQTVELNARVTAYEQSEVRPQVAGVIRRRFFTEGSIVRRGQTLYEIDPRIYSAAVSEAQANLQSARANAEATRVNAERLRPLAQMEAVSQQEYTNAAAASRQAQASVAQTQAQLETARINLRFTSVPAPITGRIGRSLATVGALVTANQTEPLAVIQRLDPIYVDIQQSSADLLALRRALSRDGVAPGRAAVRLKLEDGSDYGLTGTVEFAESIVDPSTGTVTLRARFANPNGLLLPGMFARAVFAQSINSRAFLVPQPAISRSPAGEATLFVVCPGNKAVQRKVVANLTQGTNWVVTQGLQPGDKVIVQGTGNLRPNAPIQPVPANSPQRVAPPQGGQGGQGGQSGAASPAKGG